MRLCKYEIGFLFLCCFGVMFSLNMFCVWFRKSCGSVLLKLMSFYVVKFNTYRYVHRYVSAHEYMLFMPLFLPTCLHVVNYDEQRDLL